MYEVRRGARHGGEGTDRTPCLRDSANSLGPLKLDTEYSTFPFWLMQGRYGCFILLTHEGRINHLEMVELTALKNSRTLSALGCENI